MLPASWKQVPITGQYLGLDGNPVVGKLIFESAHVVVIEGVQVVPRKIAFALESDGSIPASASLPSTNDPDISPTGWAYTVREDWRGGRKPFRLLIPFDAASVNVPDEVPVGNVDPIIDRRGPRGMSAYQTAVVNGFEGTEQAWLASLNGSGQDGDDGLSAYALAVVAGFSGSEEEWLESLRGPRGFDGDDGLSAYQIALQEGFVGTRAEWVASLKGQKGDKGDAGMSGGGASRVIHITLLSGSASV